MRAKWEKLELERLCKLAHTHTWCLAEGRKAKLRSNFYLFPALLTMAHHKLLLHKIHQLTPKRLNPKGTRDSQPRKLEKSGLPQAALLRHQNPKLGPIKFFGYCNQETSQTRSHVKLGKSGKQGKGWMLKESSGDSESSERRQKTSISWSLGMWVCTLLFTAWTYAHIACSR